MRILQVHNVATNWGGADHVMSLERDALTARGHTVDTFTIRTTEVLEQGGKVAATVFSVWNPSACRSLGERIRAVRPDVVHYHSPFPVGSLALLKVADRHDVASVWTPHEFRHSCLPGTLRRNGQICEACVGQRFKLAGVRHRCYRGSLVGSLSLATGHAIHRTVDDYRQAIDRYLVLSEFVRDVLVREGAPADRMVLKRNFVEDLGGPSPDPGDRPTGTDRPEPDDRVSDGHRPRRFAFVGRLEPEKGVATLLDAWQLLTPGEAELVIAGEGSLGPLVAARAAKRPDISYVGFQARHEVGRLLSDADLLVFPSEWYEAGPLSLLEALSARCPVIASDVGNFVETIEDGKTGFHFRSGDPHSLAAEIRRAVDLGASDLDRMQDNARAAYLANHTTDVIIAQLESVYRQVVAERTGRARGRDEARRR